MNNIKPRTKNFDIEIYSVNYVSKILKSIENTAEQDTVIAHPLEVEDGQSMLILYESQTQYNTDIRPIVFYSSISPTMTRTFSLHRPSHQAYLLLTSIISNLPCLGFAIPF